jgi:hypothetical protein
VSFVERPPRENDMVIKKVGGGAPIAATQTVGQKDTAPVEGFSEVARAKASDPTANAEVTTAVKHVAEKVSAGGLQAPPAQVDAVIEKMVELQAPKGSSPKAIRARVSEVQLALGDHPGFTSRVQAMLTRALESIDA